MLPRVVNAAKTGHSLSTGHARWRKDGSTLTGVEPALVEGAVAWSARLGGEPKDRECRGGIPNGSLGGAGGRERLFSKSVQQGRCDLSRLGGERLVR